MQKISEYTLDVTIHPKKGLLEAAAKIVLEEKVSKLDLILNKGLKAVLVKNSRNLLEFKQELKEFKEIREFKLNYITIKFPHPSNTLIIQYRGKLEEYSKVMQYLKDSVNEYYILLRLDSFSYPIPGSLEFSKLVATLPLQRFKYRARVRVPLGYVVASFGKLTENVVEDEWIVYEYISKLPDWRIDLAISKFKIVEKKDLKAYVFEKDYNYGIKALKLVEECKNFYTKSFGPPVKWAGYTIIEIPRGYGGQASVCGILIDEDNLRGEGSGLFHELAHLWNVPSGEEYVSRFLDEGFASYFQLLAEKHFLGEEHFLSSLKKIKKKFKKLVKKHPEVLEIPISDYGKYGITDFSYLTGPWLLYNLHKRFGDQCFKKLIKIFLKKFRDKPATLLEFKETAVEVCGKRVEEFLDKWLFGTEASKTMLEENSEN
ncbi:MAG TPA: hypothetical protein ENF87_02160 [Thermoproteales archaeon]|nr:hypothetical protein [Thermoproteales archaeon]